MFAHKTLLDELIKMSLPNDTAGTICGYDDANDHTILYYPNMNDPVIIIILSLDQKSMCKSLSYSKR